jgi:Na+/H+ antiporter NhaD/arsenite permease-like protein
MNKTNLIKTLAKEPLFTVLLFLTAVMSFFSKPQLSSINWNVITTLFSLMLVRTAFEKCNFLTSIAGISTSYFYTQRSLGLALIAVTGFLSMLVTNDVALLTVVPITILIAEKEGEDPFIFIILETVAANIFSALTPFGNPQNLYLYSFYNMSAAEFFRIMLPLFVFGTALVVLLNFFLNRSNHQYHTSAIFQITDPILFWGALAIFVLNILSVLRVMNSWIPFVAAVAFFAVYRPKFFLSVDYFLLGTFVLFFLFTDSVTGIPTVKTVLSAMLNSKAAVLVDSALISQALSNVPTAVLISGFTPHYRELLYGVSIGGLGTPVASLASMISYKIYTQKYPGGKYMKVFLIVNFAALALLGVAIYLYELVVG